MITRNEFRSIINRCPDGWTITFIKWEHIEDIEEIKKSTSYWMPSIVGLTEVDRFTRYNDIDGKPITVITFVEDDEHDGEPKEDIINKFSPEGDGYIEFRIEVEDSDGKSYTIEMTPEVGDFGYSDRDMHIDFEEIKH